ncbi:DUF5132 domain-containing protein [Streptomyces sp. NPDC059851]|uniref:DUF5132 domain-containing protein n=1 Tax=Streptomyces sp. NPDC059851 TaxID=3346971 RepID=UPI003661D1FB
MPPVLPPFLIGLIAAPLAKRIGKPLVRGLVKTSVGLVLEVKRAAHEATENLQDLAAEVTAEAVASQVTSAPDWQAAPAPQKDGHVAETGRSASTPVHGSQQPKGRGPAVAPAKA